MTFLCFLGALPESLETLHMDPTVLFKVCYTALNMMTNIQEPQEIAFYCYAQFTGETNCSLGDD